MKNENISRGSKHYCAKINENDVKEIRKSNLSLTKIADIYHISIPTVHDIKNRRTWKHVED